MRGDFLYKVLINRFILLFICFTNFAIANNVNGFNERSRSIFRTPPVISGCPANITTTISGCSTTTVTWTPPTASDPEEGITSFTSNYSPDDVFPAGVTTVTYTATNGIGETTICSFDVRVKSNDVFDPFTVPSDRFYDMNAACDRRVQWYEPTVNCSGLSVIGDYSSGEAFPVGETTVTYFALDGFFVVGSCSFLVTIADNLAPTFTNCPTDKTVTANNNCQAVVNWTPPTASDNCSGSITPTSTHEPGATFTLGSTLVTYTATDDSGNSVECSFTITVADQTAPVFTNLPADMVVSASVSNCKAMVSWPTVLATDNCGGTVTIDKTQAPGNLFNLGVNSVVYTATDAANNSNVKSFTITVVDDTPPTLIGCPADIFMDANIDCQVPVSWTEPNFSDKCDASLTIISSHSSGDLFTIGTTNVSYTATDDAGNQTLCSFDVTISDTSVPVFSSCPADMTIAVGDGCTAVANWTLPSATDNCDTNVLLESNFNSGDQFDLGTTQVVYTATDDAGNIATCSFNVVVEDQTAPVFQNCPGNILLSTNANCEAIANWSVPNVSDNCTTNLIIYESHSSGDIFPLGITTVSYTTNDAAGNTSSCTFDVIVTDDTAPVISNCPSDITLIADQNCEAIANWTAPVIADNCTSPLLISNSHSPGDLFPIGETTVNYTATDDAGNISICEFIVSVKDQTAPVVQNCPSNLSLAVGTNACTVIASWAVPNFIDNCNSTLTITSSHNPGDEFVVGTTTVFYTAKDDAGNIANCTFDIVVSDAIKPVFESCPANIILAADANCSAIANWSLPVASDNCNTNVLVESNFNSGDQFDLGTTQVVYTATDAAGNIANCSFNITVEDQTAPVFQNCPANIFLSANANCEAIANWSVPSVSDNCTTNLIVTESHSSGTIFPLGITTVTYTTNDASGNASTCTFDVEVTDDSAPVISSCPANITIIADQNCGGIANWTAPVINDNCTSALLISSSHSPGDLFPIGETTVNYTATDDAGNISICEFIVTVKDQTAPVAQNCPANLTFSVSANACTVKPSWNIPSFTDNCNSPLTITTNHNPGDEFVIGTTTVVYTAVDNAGNQVNCSFDIIVNDAIAPVFNSCPGNILLTADQNCEAIAEWMMPDVSDNCTAQVTLSATHNIGDAFPAGITTVVYTARDASGNTSECSFEVNVRDLSKPIVESSPANIIASTADNCNAIVSWVPPVFKDCSALEVSSNFNPGDVFPLGETKVSYSATDINGLETLSEFLVTVEDQTGPTIISCPVDRVISVTEACEAMVEWVEPVVEDNCSGTVSVQANMSSGDIFPVGITNVVYDFIDDKGNISNCSFTITVKDESEFSVIDCPQDIVIETDESGSTPVSWNPPTIKSSGCSNIVENANYQPGDIFELGDTEVIYEYLDGSGRSIVCSFLITVKVRQLEFETPDLLSPNGDGINDKWRIAGLENFPNNEVIIVDRWGGLIFSNKGYNNQDVIWDGTNTNGEIVPTGTYYYFIRVKTESDMQEKKGFIEIVN